MLYFVLFVVIMEMIQMKKHLLLLASKTGRSCLVREVLEIRRINSAHSNSVQHLTCLAKWTAHKKSKITGSIVTQLSSQHSKLVEMNRQYMRALIDIVLLLSRQGIAFRGHNETSSSLNQGNFKEICNLLAKYNPDFDSKYCEKTSYSSHRIQDELIEISSNYVRNIIINEIENAVSCSIMCDEARCFKEEQMSLCVRYCKDLNVTERFLGFIDCSQNQNAETLTQSIFEYLKIWGLNSFIPIVAQSYDGANVMSGRFNGVQARVKEKYPYAIYTHCMAHRLNLVVIDMCKLIKETRSVFNTLKALYTHFSKPSINKKYNDIQVKLGINKLSITKISDMRWNCRYKNCEAVKTNYKAIIIALEEEIENDGDKDVNEAIGILHVLKIKNLSFIYLYCIKY
ncbi:zinc finger MYM-type protein 1-like [Daktulosphaira vitifoliae]|uniref:zinc finger MYM-type protein 1-like n=1 Tax=Daktulosphaira vitifoliae TaxID=58002 RepID=UPI0021AA4933|nr:zinc finger MYM-type protein 1-like [Daktulosphaira vitifoliae]